MRDATHLDRFVDAQEPHYAAIRDELRRGRKTTHWMWFAFPQLRALGRSGTATFYGLADRAEALAYWRHPVLGPRLKECTSLVLAVGGRSAHDIFGSPDDLKLRSCMTLFEAVAPDEPGFAAALERFYRGERDAVPAALLGQSTR
jgi:uncharacterized protein (DUF1810 family)